MCDTLAVASSSPSSAAPVTRPRSPATTSRPTSFRAGLAEMRAEIANLHTPPADLHRRRAHGAREPQDPADRQPTKASRDARARVAASAANAASVETVGIPVRIRPANGASTDGDEPPRLVQHPDEPDRAVVRLLDREVDVSPGRLGAFVEVSVKVDRAHRYLA